MGPAWKQRSCSRGLEWLEQQESLWKPGWNKAHVVGRYQTMVGGRVPQKEPGLHPEGSRRAAAGSEPQDGMAGVIF